MAGTRAVGCGLSIGRVSSIYETDIMLYLLVMNDFKFYLTGKSGRSIDLALPFSFQLHNWVKNAPSGQKCEVQKWQIANV